MPLLKHFNTLFSPFLLFFTVLLCLVSSPALQAKKKEAKKEAPLHYEALNPRQKVAYLADLVFVGKNQEADEKVSQGEPSKLDPKSKKRFSVLKAYLDLEQGRAAEAEALFDSLQGNYPELEAVLPLWRAKSSRLAGNPQKAVQILEQFCGGPCLPPVPETEPAVKTTAKNKKSKARPKEASPVVSGPAPRVVREYASALCEVKDARGEEIFQNLLSGANGAERDTTRLAWVHCLQKSGETTKAFEELRSLFVQAPGALSKKQLEENAGRLGNRGFSPDDLLLRISNLKTQERWGEAAQELKEFLAQHPSERPLRRNETADTFFKARLYREAAQIYEEIVQDPLLTEKREALEKLASAYARSNQFDKALKIQSELAKAPDEEVGASQKVSYKIAFLLADAGRCDEAVSAFQEFTDRFPKSPKRDDSLWQKAWCEYRLGRTQSALADLKLLLDEFPRGNYATRASYWAYRIASLIPEENGAEAKAAFLEKYPESFYERWDQIRRGLPSNQCPALPLATHLGEEKVSPSFFFSFSDGDRTALAELLSLGLWEDFMEIYRKGTGEEGNTSDDLKKWIRLFAEREGVSEDLVWAILREESRFKSKALSSAGAMGLMQIIPQTGYEIARSLNWSAFKPSDLYQPIVNVRMGTHYLAMLLRQFSGNSVYTIASYNAGPDAVARWEGQRSSRPCEEFIEEIPYRETHLYVKKVMRSLWNFRENPSAFYAGD